MELINFLATAEELCGPNGSIPTVVFNLTSLVILAIQIVVPILLIIWGMIDFTKAVIGQNEDKIKDAQKIFVKRLIAAAIVFLTVTIVKLLVGIVGNLGEDAEGEEGVNTSWATCIDRFISGGTGN